MSRFRIIPEDFELNKEGRPVNSNGKRLKINNTGKVVYKNGKPVYENENENETNFQLPKRIKQNILQHPKSKNSYIIIKNKNKNGIEIEKFVKVNKEQMPIKDGDNYIYLNKENGIAITGNGRKYVVNSLTSELSKNRNGYIIEKSNNSNILPKRMNQPSTIPSPGMMRVEKQLPPGGFIGNRKPKPNSSVFVPKKSNNSSNFGSMFTSGPAPKSNQVPTVIRNNVLPRNPIFSGFRIG